MKIPEYTLITGEKIGIITYVSTLIFGALGAYGWLSGSCITGLYSIDCMLVGAAGGFFLGFIMENLFRKKKNGL
jgi:hypothetical protein